jgi:Fur family ferric uptake transcriptional regulator
MRYDPNTVTPHQHLVCVSCGGLRDVRPEGEIHLRLPRKERHGFQVEGVEIVFRGLCPECQAATA